MEIEDLMLFKAFRRCAHLQYRMNPCQGQAWILILLAQRGGMTQRELADITQRRPATLSEQLEALEAAGLILRGKNADDKRNVDLKLTGRGLEAAREAEAEREKTARALFSGLGGAKRAALYEALTELGAAWEALAGKVRP